MLYITISEQQRTNCRFWTLMKHFLYQLDQHCRIGEFHDTGATRVFWSRILYSEKRCDRWPKIGPLRYSTKKHQTCPDTASHIFFRKPCATILKKLCVCLDTKHVGANGLCGSWGCGGLAISWRGHGITGDVTWLHGNETVRISYGWRRLHFVV